MRRASAGVILASRLNSVDLTAGGGTLLLDAISAAVIGGVSLFGGRGQVSGALLRRPDHRDDRERHRPRRLRPTGSSTSPTGTILLAAVTLDTVARRRQATAGR